MSKKQKQNYQNNLCESEKTSDFLRDVKNLI